MVLLLLACLPSTDDSGGPVTLAPTTTPPTTTITVSTWTPTTPGTTTGDRTPEHTLTITQSGLLQLSPPGGPYTSLVGTVVHEELLDGGLACTATFAVTGTAADREAPDAAWTQRILFYLVEEGDPKTGEFPRSACRDTEAPDHDDAWGVAWQSTGGNQGTVLRDWNDVGAWIAWWPGEVTGDVVDFSWDTTVAVAVEEEET